MMNYKHLSIITLAGLLALASCKQPDPIPTEVSEDTYAGGQLGTTFNTSSSAYEDPAPAVTDIAAFKKVAAAMMK